MGVWTELIPDVVEVGAVVLQPSVVELVDLATFVVAVVAVEYYYLYLKFDKEYYGSLDMRWSKSKGFFIPIYFSQDLQAVFIS